ncbi:MAG: hypothetical protein LUH63_08795 [Parabacteroides sp.]|nr:hypothetical protein [Parabacteroides sp.]
MNGSLVFMEDENPILVMQLSTIYGTLRAGDTLYILCKNSVLHYFDRKTHQHWVALLDNTHNDISGPMLN